MRGWLLERDFGFVGFLGFIGEVGMGDGNDLSNFILFLFYFEKSIIFIHYCYNKFIYDANGSVVQIIMHIHQMFIKFFLLFLIN